MLPVYLTHHICFISGITTEIQIERIKKEREREEVLKHFCRRIYYREKVMCLMSNCAVWK